MALYVPTSFGQLIKVGEKEDDGQYSNEPSGPDEECDVCYFKLIIWELEKQLEKHRQKLREAEKRKQAERLKGSVSSFPWLSEFGTSKASITPMLYQLVEKKCSELLPQYARSALQTFQTTDFGEMPLEDIPFTLLAILRTQKLEQDASTESTNTTTSIFNRIEQWMSWSQVVRNRGKVAPDVELGGPLTTIKPRNISTSDVTMTSQPVALEMESKLLPTEGQEDKGGTFGNLDKAISRRSLLNLKGRDFHFKKFPVSRRYSTLSDEAAKSLFVTTSTSPEEFKEIALNSSEVSASSDDVTAREKLRSKMKQFKDGAVSIIGSFRHGRRLQSTSPI